MGCELGNAPPAHVCHARRDVRAQGALATVRHFLHPADCEGDKGSGDCERTAFCAGGRAPDQFPVPRRPMNVEAAYISFRELACMPQRYPDPDRGHCWALFDSILLFLSELPRARLGAPPRRDGPRLDAHAGRGLPINCHGDQRGHRDHFADNGPHLEHPAAGDRQRASCSAENRAGLESFEANMSSGPREGRCCGRRQSTIAECDIEWAQRCRKRHPRHRYRAGDYHRVGPAC
jgi:hypothetical protein